MRKSLAPLVAFAALCHPPASMAAVVNITADGTWFEFATISVGDAWRSPVDGDVLTFSLTSPLPFVLRVVDTGFAGDRVEVGAAGLGLLGRTSAVAADDTVFALSPDEALLAPGTWSQGQWSLAAGSYSFSGTAVTAPFGAAAWAISAVADATTPTVPEPATIGMVLVGLALASMRLRKAH